jgi:hypothetical protein
MLTEKESKHKDAAKLDCGIPGRIYAYISSQDYLIENFSK